MSRLAVQAQTSKRSLVFKPIEETSEHEPMLYLPGDILSPGNSIGGYLTVPDKAGDTWGLWRIGGSTKSRLSDPELRSEDIVINGLSRYKREVLKIVSSQEPEAIARNYGRYLIALSSGSARRGLLHNFDRSSDPILDVLRSSHLPTDQVERVVNSDGEYSEDYQYLFPRFHYYNVIHTDGNSEVAEETIGEEADSRYDPNYPSGNGFSKRTVFVNGSTYVISAHYAHSRNNVGPFGVPLRAVAIKLTPEADIQKVAKILSEITSKS